MNYVIENVDALVDVVEAALVLASLVVALTPTKEDDGVVDRLRNVFSAFKAFRLVRR